MCPYFSIWKSTFVTNFQSTNSAAHSVCESIEQPKWPFQLGSRRKQTEQVPDVANAASAQRVSLKRPLGEGGVPHKRSLEHFTHRTPVCRKRLCPPLIRSDAPPRTCGTAQRPSQTLLIRNVPFILNEAAGLFVARRD